MGNLAEFCVTEVLGTNHLYMYNSGNGNWYGRQFESGGNRSLTPQNKRFGFFPVNRETFKQIYF